MISRLYNSKTNKIFCESGKKISKPKIEKESRYDTIKNIRNLFKLKKENKANKDQKISDIRNIFELENENYYKPIRVGNFYGNICIKYEGNSDRDKKSIN